MRARLMPTTRCRQVAHTVQRPSRSSRMGCSGTRTRQRRRGRERMVDRCAPARRPRRAPPARPHGAASSDSEPTRGAARRHRSGRGVGRARTRCRRTRGRGGPLVALGEVAATSQWASSWRSVRRWSSSSVPARTATIPSLRRVTPVDCSPARRRQARRGCAAPASAQTAATSESAQAGAVIGAAAAGGRPRAARRRAPDRRSGPRRT